MAEGYYYNAIAEHPIIPEFDDKEIKYKWNGALLNLSDLPVSEYTKTIFNVVGEVTGETKVLTNTIKLSYEKTGDTYEIVATPQYPCNDDVEITVTVAGESNPIKISLKKGASSGRAATTIPSSSPEPEVSEPTVDPIKDDVYTYVVKTPTQSPTEFDLFYGIYLEKDLANLTPAIVSAMSTATADFEGAILQYVIPQRDVEIDESDIPNYKYALICAIPKDVYDDELYTITETTFQADDFVRLTNMTIGSQEYTVLKNTKEDYEYVSRYKEDITYEFIIKCKEV